MDIVLPDDAIGIDIGIKNLALCRLQVEEVNGRDEYRIAYWNVVDLIGLEKNMPRLACEGIPNVLAVDAESVRTCTNIVIEQQPHFNVTMRIISHALITYFHTLWREDGVEGETKISSASNKLKPFQEAGAETKYAERKRNAVNACATLIDTMVREARAHGDLESAQRHTELAKWYVALDKRDDAADALLHAYYWLFTQREELGKKRARARARAEKAAAKAAAKAMGRKRKSSAVAAEPIADEPIAPASQPLLTNSPTESPLEYSALEHVNKRRKRAPAKAKKPTKAKETLMLD